MSETDFLKTILETEGVAGEMIFNAKASMKDRVSQARSRADEIRNNARIKAAEKHKECLADANAQAAASREAVLAETASDAGKLKAEASLRMETAAKKTAEGIIKIFADR